MNFKKFLVWLTLVCALLTIFFIKEDVYAYILEKFIYHDEMIIKDANEYKVDYEYGYIQNTNDFKPKNKKELLNILYTIVNNGWDSYAFFCDSSYDNCISDVKDIINENYHLSNINNFVHPYNNYAQINVFANGFGLIEIEIDKLYSEQDIAIMNAEVERIYNLTVTDDMSSYDKIKAIHDYIINNTKYLQEEERGIDGELSFPMASNTAYGLLKNHVANCAGYTDTMSIFLHKLGVPNYKISNIIGAIDPYKEYHIWNLASVDGVWKHLDLTWDDPVMSSGRDVLSHDYFLITQEKLDNMNIEEHDFDSSVYIEAKSN